MRTRLAFPVLIILQFQVITAQNVSLEDFKIGMFGVKANKESGVYVSESIIDGYRTSTLNTFSDDGFNIIMSYIPDFYTYNDYEDVLNLNLLAKDNNMMIANRAYWWVRPGYSNVYVDPNRDRDHPDYEYIFSNIYNRSDLNGWIWGHELTEEASYLHPFNPYTTMGPKYYPSSWSIDTYPASEGLYSWIPDNFVMAEIPVSNINAAIDDFQTMMSSNGITNQKLVLMEANHQKSIHDDTNDGEGSVDPQQIIQLLSNEPSTVFFEGSYQQFHINKWDNAEYIYTNMNNDGPDYNFHYLSKFKNIDYAYQFTDEVHAVISNSLADPSLHYNHFHSNQLIENANWMWFKTYTSIIHGAAGVWFWSYNQSYDTSKSSDIINKAILNDETILDRFNPNYFSEIYLNYTRHLARELCYLKNNGYLDNDPASIICSKTDNEDAHGIVPSFDQYLNPLSIDSEYKKKEYGLRYTIRTNGDEVIMIITNPLNVSVQNVPLSFSQLSNPIMKYATSVDVLFETNALFVTDNLYKVTRNSVDLPSNEVIQSYSLPIENGLLSLSFGPFDTHVLKFNSQPANYENEWENLWTNNGNNQLNSWAFKDTDMFYPGDFDGDEKEELLCVNEATGGWLALKDFENHTWEYNWNNGGSSTSNMYIYNFRENITVGDFDGDGDDDLLGVSSYGTRIFYFDGNQFQQLWYLPSSSSPIWPYKNQLYAGDFNNDGKDEILGVGPSDIKLFQYSSGTVNSIWTGTSSHSIWLYRDEFIVGDFDGNGADEVIGNDLPSGWMTRFRYSSDDFQWGPWSNYGLSHNLLPYREDLLSGDFDLDGKDELLGFDPPAGWVTLFDFENNDFIWSWSTYGKSFIDDWDPDESASNATYLAIKVNEGASDYLFCYRKYDPNYIASMYSYLPTDINLSGSTYGKSDDWDVKYSDGADDAYIIYIPYMASLTATTCNPITDFDTKLEIFNEDGTSTGIYNDDHSCSQGIGNYSSMVNTTLEKGYYYIVVDGYNGAVGNYGLDIDIEYIFTLPFTVNGYTTGRPNDWDVQFTDYSDFEYKFHIPSSTTISVNLCNDFLDYTEAKFEIFHENGTTTNYYKYDYYCPNLSNISLNPGYYYLVVDGYNQGQYQVEVNESPTAKGAPILESVINSEFEDRNDHLNSDQIQIFPNPATDIVTIKLIENDSYKIEIISMNGMVMKSVDSSNNIVKISCADIESGIYIVNIATSEQSFQKKLVITK